RCKGAAGWASAGSRGTRRPAPSVSAPPPPFTEEHEQLRDSVRGFLERELTPHAAQWEQEEWFPDEVFPLLARQGLLGLKYPAEYGGQGGDYLHEAILCEELARIGSGGTAAGIGAHVNIATPPIWKFGTEEQKQRYLVPAIRGAKIRALGITEPGAGSDVASLPTRAAPAERGLQADHGQLPVGAPRHGARRGRRDAARVGAHGRLRARAPHLRPPALRPPGDPPQARRPRHLDLRLPLRHL